MPFVVNDELVPEELVHMEAVRLRSHPDFSGIKDEVQRSMRIREGAEVAAVNRVLLAQHSRRDTRPIPEKDIEGELAARRSRRGARAQADAGGQRRLIEAQLRLRRTVGEIRASALVPTDAEIEAAYIRYRGSFVRPERVRALQIVKHLGPGVDELGAKAQIEAALCELEAGAPFAEVADRYSDCKGRGGDLGYVQRGAMVGEFENVVFSMRPGERSGIFRTNQGLHIAQVLDVRPAGVADLAEVREELGRKLRAYAEYVALYSETERLRSEAVIRRVTRAEARRLSARGCG